MYFGSKTFAPIYIILLDEALKELEAVDAELQSAGDENGEHLVEEFEVWISSSSIMI